MVQVKDFQGHKMAQLHRHFHQPVFRQIYERKERRHCEDIYILDAPFLLSRLRFELHQHHRFSASVTISISWANSEARAQGNQRCWWGFQSLTSKSGYAKGALHQILEIILGKKYLFTQTNTHNSHNIIHYMH